MLDEQSLFTSEAACLLPCRLPPVAGPKRLFHDPTDSKPRPMSRKTDNGRILITIDCTSVIKGRQARNDPPDTVDVISCDAISFPSSRFVYLAHSYKAGLPSTALFHPILHWRTCCMLICSDEQALLTKIYILQRYQWTCLVALSSQ